MNRLFRIAGMAGLCCFIFEETGTATTVFACLIFIATEAQLYVTTIQLKIMKDVYELVQRFYALEKKEKE